MLDADLVAAVGAFHLDATLRDRDDVLAAVGISPAAGAVRLDGEGSVACEFVDAAEAVFGLGDDDQSVRRRIPTVRVVYEPPCAPAHKSEQKRGYQA